WLEEHNPEIDWQTKEVKMSRSNNDNDKFDVKDDSPSATDDEVNPVAPEDRFQEGDQLFYINLLMEEEFIHTTQIVSSRLAEAHSKNVKVETHISEYLREFEDIFSKKSFDSLPHE
ncbi:hypothetical protein M422DRAFT_134032, partial [Sphaerobolus stellatus SS14]